MHPRPPDPQDPASFPWYFAAHGRYQGSYNQHSNRGLGNSARSTPLVTLPQAEGQVLLLLLPLEGEAQIKHHPHLQHTQALDSTASGHAAFPLGGSSCQLIPANQALHVGPKPPPLLPSPDGVSVFILNIRNPSLFPSVLLRRCFGHQLGLPAEFSVWYKEGDVRGCLETMGPPSPPSPTPAPFLAVPGQAGVTSTKRALQGCK